MQDLVGSVHIESEEILSGFVLKWIKTKSDFHLLKFEVLM